MAKWLLKLDMGGWQNEYTISGPRTADEAKAEFQRQQKTIGSDGQSMMPPGEVMSIEPRDPKRLMPKTTDMKGNPVPVLGEPGEPA